MSAPAEPRGPFPASARVRKRREYQRIQSRGQRLSLQHFVLIVAAREAGDTRGPRLGITASRKIGGAAVRNRAKRLVREAFRATRDLFPPDIDVVVIVRTPLGALRLADVVAELRSAQEALSRRIAAARRDRDSKPPR